jgi:hypothetical protein
VAASDRNARVIYGDDRYSDPYATGRVYEDGRYENRSGGSTGVTGAVRDRILRNRNPNQAPRAGAGRVSNSAAYDNGFRDGLEKGREDVQDNDSFDPVRHSRYRSADRGYDEQYGTKEQYKLTYRDGFEAGYQQGYGRSPRSF